MEGVFRRNPAYAMGCAVLASLWALPGCLDPGPIPPSLQPVADGLNNPTGLAVRPDGTLLVAESGAGRVISLDSEGKPSTLVANFTLGSFYPYTIGPLSLTLLADGTLIVGEGGRSTGRERISFYDTDGIEIPDSALVPVSGSNFNGVAVHPQTGDLYAAGTESDRIFRAMATDGGGFSPAEDFVASTIDPPLSRRAPAALAFESDGALLAALADFTGSAVMRLNTDPAAETVLTAVLYESPAIVTALAVHPSSGSIYFTEADYAANRLGAGRLARLVERDGAMDAETLLDGLAAPSALAIGPDGVLYLATLGDTPNADTGMVWAVTLNEPVDAAQFGATDESAPDAGTAPAPPNPTETGINDERADNEAE